MSKIIPLTLLGGGLFLVIISLTCPNLSRPELIRFFTGHPTSKAVWMFLGGSSAAMVGLMATIFGQMRNYNLPTPVLPHRPKKLRLPV